MEVANSLEQAPDAQRYGNDAPGVKMNLPQNLFDTYTSPAVQHDLLQWVSSPKTTKGKFGRNNVQHN